MKFKKHIALGIAALITVSALAACGSSDNGKESSGGASSQVKESSSAVAGSESEAVNTTEIVFPLEETMEFTAMALLWKDEYPLSDNLAWNTALERANIQVELTQLPRAEAQEKGKLIMASGDYPDFLFKMGCLGSYYDYGLEGIVIPLEDLIREYAPNLTALLDERDAWSIISSADGHIYSLPVIKPSEMYTGNSVWWINKTWMDNLGLEEPNNMDELYQVLKAFKEQDANGNGDPNDEIPLSFYGNQYDTLLGYIGDGLYYVNEHMAIMDEELVYYPYTEGYKDFLGQLVQMYEEGLIDVNALTQTMDQWVATSQSGNVLGMFYQTNPSYCPEEYQADYITLTPFVPDNFPLSTGISTGTMAITDKCENPEVLIAWADYFYSLEGGYLSWWGVEGETFEFNVDGTYSVTGITSGKYEHMAQFTLKGAADAPLLLDASIYYNLLEEGVVSQALEAAKYADGGVYSQGTVLPTLTFTEEEKEALSTLTTDINGYLTNYNAQVIAGDLDLESSWEEFQSTLKTMGADELLSIYQAAYERATK